MNERKYPHDERVRKVIRKCSERVVKDGLNYLIPNWKQSVASLEKETELDEYLNDVDGRDIIRQILTVLRPDEIMTVEKDLKPIDDLFREKTTATSQCIWGARNERHRGWNRVEHWYYYRAPMQLLPDLDSIYW